MNFIGISSIDELIKMAEEKNLTELFRHMIRSIRDPNERRKRINIMLETLKNKDVLSKEEKEVLNELPILMEEFRLASDNYIY